MKIKQFYRDIPKVWLAFCIVLIGGSYTGGIIYSLGNHTTAYIIWILTVLVTLTHLTFSIIYTKG